MVGDNVSAIFPVYTKTYRLDDIKQDGTRPDPASLKVILEEINRFYEGESAGARANAAVNR